MDHQAKGLAFVPVNSCGSAPPIVRHSGNAQVGLVGQALALPLVARTQNSQGQPLPGVTVTFQTVSGGGSVSPTSVTSNSEGLAQTTATLGPNPGANVFNASVVSFGTTRAVNFGATGVLDLTPDPVEPIIQIGQDGVVNGATFAVSSGVAPGSIATIFGTNLAASSYDFGLDAIAAALTEGAAADDDQTTILEGTQVFVNGTPAPVFFVSPTQINFQVPPDVPVGNAQVQVVWPVSFLPIVSKPVTAAIVAHGPGVFSNPPGSTGQGAVLNANNSANSASNPAARGSIIQIFATGLGPTSPAVAAGVRAPSSPPSLMTSTPQVLIGGTPAEVQFAGLAPGFVGLYQINVVVPQGVTPGSSVNLQIVVGGQTSRQVTVAVQ
jgi:uncharacterized protein (TIGR03437 family)